MSLIIPDLAIINYPSMSYPPPSEPLLRQSQLTRGQTIDAGSVDHIVNKIQMRMDIGYVMGRCLRAFADRALSIVMTKECKELQAQDLQKITTVSESAFPKRSEKQGESLRVLPYQIKPLANSTTGQALSSCFLKDPRIADLIKGDVLETMRLQNQEAAELGLCSILGSGSSPLDFISPLDCENVQELEHEMVENCFDAVFNRSSAVECRQVRHDLAYLTLPDLGVYGQERGAVVEGTLPELEKCEFWP